MYSLRMFVATVITVLIICSASLRIGFEFRDYEWDFTTTMWLSSGVITLALCFLGYLAKKQAESFKTQLEAQKGQTLNIEEAFRVGEIVKVLGVSRHHEYAILKGITSSVKTVTLPRYNHEHVGVDKHYMVGETGSLIDFIEAGKRSEKNIELVEEN